MNDNDSRTHQMVVRARECMAQNVEDFVAGGAARQLFTQLQTKIMQVEELLAAHGRGISQAREGTRTRGETRGALQADIDAIYNAARAMGVENQFPRPALGNDESLLQAADVYGVNALPLKTQFIAHELPPDFLENLAADKAAFRGAIAGQTNAVGDHISAREELDDALGDAVRIVRQIDPIMKVKYANNPGKLAEWKAASHIEAPPRRAKPAPSASPPAAPPPST